MLWSRAQRETAAPDRAKSHNSFYPGTVGLVKAWLKRNGRTGF